MPKRRKRKGKGKAMSVGQAIHIARSKKNNVPYFHPHFKCFMLKNKRLKGVRPFIRQLLFPSYTMPSHSKSNGVRTPGGGLARGRAVSHDLVKYCKSTRAQRSKLKLHKYTRKLILALKQWGWTPHKAEFTVAWERGHIGTAVDLLVREKFVDSTSKRTRTRLVAIEIKCGMLGSWDRTSASPQKYLKHPLDHYVNSQKNHALLQLALTHAMVLLSPNARRLKPYPVSSDAYVVRITEDGVCRIKLPQWCKGQAVRHMRQVLQA